MDLLQYQPLKSRGVTALHLTVRKIQNYKSCSSKLKYMYKHLILQCEEYGNLYMGALKNHGILCLGLYRNVDPRSSACNYNRFIITNPPANFVLVPSDKVSITP